MDVYYGSCNLSGGYEICPFGSDWSHHSYFELSMVVLFEIVSVSVAGCLSVYYCSN